MHYIKLVIIGFFLFVPASIFAAEVGISSGGSVAPGGTVTLTMIVTNVTDLFSTAFDIQYDPAILSFTSAQKGAFLEQGGGTTTLLTSAQNGTLIVGYARQAVGGVSTGVNGSGNLVTLTFTALTAGTSNITFLNNALCSSVGFMCTEIPAIWSNTSVTISGTGTPADTTAPIVAITAPAEGATVSGTITVSATATDNVGVLGVQFKQDATNIGAEDTSSPYSASLNTASLSNGTHTLTAVARDSAGNTTTANTITITVNNTVADTTAPSTPTNLSATAVSTSQINLSWSASTDATGVTGYTIYRNGTQLTTTTGTTYQHTGLSPSTLYTYTVSAYDAAGNTSSPSTSASATTQATAQVATDTTAPTITSFTIPNTSTSLTTTVSSLVATDAQGVTGYKITETPSAPLSSDAGWSSTIPTTYIFSNAGSKTLYAWAKDSAGNVSSGVQASTTITLPVVTPTTTTTTQQSQPTTISQNTNTSTPVTTTVPAPTITPSTSNATTAPTLPIGCMSGFAFSILTGERCSVSTTPITTLSSPASPALAPSVAPATNFVFANERPITYGTKNSTDVRELQKVLQREGFLASTSPIDGSFFSGTKNAVIKFQQKYGITPAEGFVGPITKKKLNELSGSTAISSTPATNTSTISTGATFIFSRNLTIGSRGEDVRKLQQILNADPMTRIAQTGAGSLGNETTYFGPATKNAVIKYQQKQGIIPSSGYVGQLTRNKLNSK